MPYLLGIDVGYSEKRRSIGVALKSDRNDPGRLSCIFANRRQYMRTWVTGNFVVEAVTLRKTELENAFQALGSALRGGKGILVVDGPILPDNPPEAGRAVDRYCMQGLFQNRAVAAPINGGEGKRLLQATRVILEGIFGNNIPKAFGPTNKRPLVLETNPTIGLAMLSAPVANINDIPARRDGLAKSDYYWDHIANGRCVAQVLGNGEIAQERNHELRAALYALAVADQVRHNSQETCYLGDSHGVFVLLGGINVRWHEAFGDFHQHAQ